MGILSCLTVIFGLLLALEPGIACAGGGETATTVVADGVAAVVTLAITNQCYHGIVKNHSGSSTTEFIVRQWLKGIHDAIGIRLRYTPDMHRRLVNRAKLVTSTKQRLAKKGGKQMILFLDKVWTFTVPVSDIIANLEKENAELKENLLLAEQQRKDLEKTNDTLKKQVCFLSHKQQKGAQGIGDKDTRGRRRQSLEEYSERHYRRLKRKRTTSCAASLAWMEEEGLTPVKVIAKNTWTDQLETIVLDDSNICEALHIREEDPSKEDIEVINMMLYTKDRFHVSGGAYHEMAKVCKQMPRHYRVKQRITELNRLWNIYRTPNGTCGVQQSLEDRLLVRLKHLVQVTPPNAPFKATQTIRIKLAGDGTRIGKHLHVVNFTFALLDEGSKAYTYEGNHVLAIFKEPEDYESLKRALEDVIAEVERLTVIEIDGIKYSIQYYLGGDWKFLALVTGIDSAISQYSCIWCKCPREERYNPEKMWSLTDPSQGARTIDENVTNAEKRRRKQFNVSHTPLFPMFPLSRVVIDNLHLFLRVADVLIDLLIVELKRHDAIEKVKKFSSFDPEKFKHLDKFQNFVSSLGVPGYAFYVGKDSKHLKSRTLTGPEKLKLFRNICIADLLPKLNPSSAAKIQSLWEEMLELNSLFSKRPDEFCDADITNYEQKSREWGRKFIRTYHEDNVTPYIHALMNHVGEFMKLHGSILQFSQHGLEKYNDIMTKEYFRATNHRGEAALRQIMEKQNRLEHLSDLGARTTKYFSITCSNCGGSGHNKLTCFQQCKMCNYTPFRAHLVDYDGKRIPACEKEN